MENQKKKANANPGNPLRDVVIFDVDGTLVDTLPHVYRSTIKAHEKFKLKPPLLDHFRSVYDQSDRFRKCCRSLKIPEHIIDEYNFYVYKFFKEDIRKNKPEIIPTAQQMLRILKNKGTDVKILSLENYENTVYKFGALFFNEIFSEILSPENGKPDALVRFKKRDPLRRVIYVGDCVSDGEAAISANVPFIGLATAYSFSHESKIIEFAKRNIEKAKYALSHFHMISVYDGMGGDSAY